MGQTSKPLKPVSRRFLLETGASIGFVAATADWAAAEPRPEAANAGGPTSGSASSRQLAVFRIRQAAAQAYLDASPPVHTSNGDETRYEDKRASFSKTLPHNDAGEVDVDAFKVFVSILANADANGFETIPRDRIDEVALNDPQATYAFDLVGLDSAATALDSPPTFSSALMASEMAEIYWLSLTRDVPFRHYERDSLVLAATSDINAFSQPLKSGSPGKLTASTVFRGETSGDLVGPYPSQFLWLDIPYGIKSLEQRYVVPARGQDFLTDYADWLDCQRGAKPRSGLRFDATPRFICSARELAEYVHRDFSFQAYMNAALIILSLGKDALSPTNPYRTSRTQFGDITLGSKNVLSMLAQAALLGQKGAYFHKWQVHRRLRPECFAARVETHAAGRRQYDLHGDILQCEAVARVHSHYGTRLLPVAFPEGSPTHPSYPSAHACNAGACATILKAFFDTDYVLPHPVEATADGLALEPWQGARLTLGNEIDKLASNIALGRDAAGVHYRSDSINGLVVGEQQAIGLLRDYSRTYNERFDGFVVRKFSGEKLRIMAGEVRPL
jgi:membrane-associated phospholipid phosphatase